MGPDLLGADFRNLPQHHPWRSYGHRCGGAVDLQFRRQLDLVPMFNMHLTAGDNFGHWFTYGLYGIICLLAALFVWRLVPETKGKTLEDMTEMWKNKK